VEECVCGLFVTACRERHNVDCCLSYSSEHRCAKYPALLTTSSGQSVQAVRVVCPVRRDCVCCRSLKSGGFATGYMRVDLASVE
jgi:hypothetical protein